MPSNILSLFNPPPPGPIDTDPCLPCTAIQLVAALAGGLYFCSDWAFKDFKTGKFPTGKDRPPLWWVRTVRGSGVLLIGLSAYRAGEVAQMVLKKRN